MTEPLGTEPMNVFRAAAALVAPVASMVDGTVYVVVATTALGTAKALPTPRSATKTLAPTRYRVRGRTDARWASLGKTTDVPPLCRNTAL
jgi:hypothetical protein